MRVNLGALIVGGLIFCFPFLYGDSYHSLSEILNHPKSYSFLFLLFLILLKPLASSLTLGAGGDGGVFAPSIVAGAFLGFTFALFCNTFFWNLFNLCKFCVSWSCCYFIGIYLCSFNCTFFWCVI
ncbi:chloride channel protein [Chryseobacterium sp. P1-3]|uniref:chloride channel protein n=1 Tax=Chryseobacterium sp. (strain P1-3) TaxID=1517683 RepID=UPI0026C8D810|nr:chloride channel protein [Chryseobacterium sp. P1-3]